MTFHTSMATLREQLVDVLRHDAYTARELADEIGVRVRDVIDHLGHIRRSHKRDFHIEPAECTKCRFVFSDRDKLQTPSRCPKCRNERITEPRFSIATSR